MTKILSDSIKRLVNIKFKVDFRKLSFNPGVPPSDYMNASLIKFPGMRQQFIATQAPLQNIIPSFWQMVAEQNVRDLLFYLNYSNLW